MKKEVVIFILALILISPMILAEEQAQTYEGFNRFVDNVRLFFSFGDSKVSLALEVKDKEVNSAMVNTENENIKKADKNLENAWKKLQLIQEKVSLKTANEVKESSNKIINTINSEENLSENFEVYSLEEEKTGLTAEWVIEVNGQEGQTLTPEVVVNVTESQNRMVEIETRIDEIDTEISDWVVEHTYAEGTTAGGEAGVVVEGGLTKVVKDEVAQGDSGLKPEVKTSVAGDAEKNKVSGNGDGGYAEGTTAGGSGGENSPDSNGVAEGDGGEGDYSEGTTAEGTDAGGDGSIGSSEGSGDVSPAGDSGGDSGSGDSSSSEGSSESGSEGTTE